jgi:uncharacterized protein YdcH (DUF465 family)
MASRMDHRSQTLKEWHLSSLKRQALGLKDTLLRLCNLKLQE